MKANIVMKIVYRTPAAVYRRWVEALRSGKYVQGTGYLRRGSCFCAYGVLCDLAAKDGGAEWGNMRHDKVYRYSGEYFGAPLAFRSYLNLTIVESGTIMAMNDHGRSFSQIADYIESIAVKNIKNMESV